MDKQILNIIDQALQEDMPNGDVTSEALFSDEQGHAVLIAKAEGILSGLDIFTAVMRRVDEDTIITPVVQNGTRIKTGTVLAQVQGNIQAILKAERTALNILQRMSGIATMTKTYVEKTRGTRCMIMDTRKTAPNLRILDKRAVKDGGGVNHRMSLSDMVLIKDNHIHAAGIIEKAVQTARAHVGFDMPIEIEVETFAQFIAACETDVERIMLDNMTLTTMRECVENNKKKKLLEASGNMKLENIAAVAATGVDAISVGALTHSVQAFDISLKFKKVGESHG